MDYKFYLSLLLFFISLRVYRSGAKRGQTAIFSILAIVYLLLVLAWVCADYFTGVGINDAVLYTIFNNIGGAGFGAYWKLAVWISLGLVGVVVLSYFYYKTTKAIHCSTNRIAMLAWVLIVASLCLNPFIVDVYGSVYGITGKYSTDIYKDKYLEYASGPAQSEQYNLVYIYAESLEGTYFYGAQFKNLVPKLQALKSRSIDFTNINEVTGSTFTIAGMVSSQCGVPLFVPYNGKTYIPYNGNSSHGTDSFYPKATCMGDVLAEKGFHTVFVQGSSLAFSGIDNFYSSHKFSEIYGSENIPRDNSKDSPWGMYDDDMLDFAFSKYQDLENKKQKFALFVSTIDTHHPDGLPSKSCTDDGVKYQDGKVGILNAVRCSDLLLSRFINKIIQSDGAKNTIIVVTSDHLAMNNTAFDLLNKNPRKELFFMLHPAHPDGFVVKKPASVLDNGVTVLNALGLNVSYALGRNLLSESSLYEEISDFSEHLLSWRDEIMELWAYPKFPEFVVPDVKKGKIKLGEYSYNYPALFNISGDGEITPYFEFDSPVLFPDFLANFKHGDKFYWVDSCERLQAYFKTKISESGVVCGASGVSGEHVHLARLMDGVKNRVEFSDEYHRYTTLARDTDRFIAHAGGAIDGNAYTDTLDALEASYKKGFKLFEFDFSETADGYYAATHDWDVWKQMTGYAGALPPTRDVFLKQKIMHRYTPLDLDTINQWFNSHPDAILVTDKVDKPADFAAKFIDKRRLMMELFSDQSVDEALATGIYGVMPTWDLVAAKGDGAVDYMRSKNLKLLVASRTALDSSPRLVKSLIDGGIQIYAFHVNREPGKDEAYMVCHEFKYFYGMYADNWDFSAIPDASICAKNEAFFKKPF